MFFEATDTHQLKFRGYKVPFTLYASIARRVINSQIDTATPGLRLCTDRTQSIECDLTTTVLVLRMRKRSQLAPLCLWYLY